MNMQITIEVCQLNRLKILHRFRFNFDDSQEEMVHVGYLLRCIPICCAERLAYKYLMQYHFYVSKDIQFRASGQ